MKTKAIRKLALLLVVIMVFSSILMTTASAEDDVVQFGFNPYYGVDAENNVNYLGTETGGFPDDLFAVAVEYDSVSTPICWTQIDISWDASKIQLIYATDGEDILSAYSGRIPTGTTGVVNDELTGNREPGNLITNKASAGNWNYTVAGFPPQTYTLTEAAICFLYFKPLSAEPANVTFSFNFTQAQHKPVGLSYDLVSEGTSAVVKLNGGAADVDPVKSLGAKVNQALKGIRFGSEYNKKDLKEVEEIGMLLYPTAKLGADTLDMDYYLANPFSAENETGVVKVQAIGISASDFVPGRAFGLYDKFVYFVTLLNVPDANLATDVTAVPFIVYADGEIVYGDPLVRNYNAVLAASDDFDE